jgi:hypothetical protein
MHDIMNTPSPVGGGSGWGHEDTYNAYNAPLPASPLQGEGLILFQENIYA